MIDTPNTALNRMKKYDGRSWNKINKQFIDRKWQKIVPKIYNALFILNKKYVNILNASKYFIT